MSRSVGNSLLNRMRILRNWHVVADRVAGIVSQRIPSVEVYAFGSIVEGKVTGASDIDLLIAVPDDHDELEAYIELSKMLEEQLGSTAYIVDLHVVCKNNIDKPPYKWWLGKSIRIL